MYLALEKGMTLHLNKLESSSPRDALCKIWLILVSDSGEIENAKTLQF